MILTLYRSALYNQGMITIHKCLRCGHEWPSRLERLPEVCPKCNSPYWNKPKVKQSGPKMKARGYDTGDGLWFYSRGRAKLENLSVDGPARRTITSKPSIGIKSGQPSHVYVDVDRRDDNTTIVRHTVKGKMENGEWETVHQDEKKGKAKHRPKKTDEKP